MGCDYSVSERRGSSCITRQRQLWCHKARILCHSWETVHCIFWVKTMKTLLSVLFSVCRCFGQRWIFACWLHTVQPPAVWRSFAPLKRENLCRIWTVSRITLMKQEKEECVSWSCFSTAPWVSIMPWSHQKREVLAETVSVVFGPRATKSGRPYGVMCVSLWRTPHSCPTLVGWPPPPGWLPPPPPPPWHDTVTWSRDGWLGSAFMLMKRTVIAQV